MTTDSRPQEARELHGAIMNIPAVPPADANINQILSYKAGHRDARHAAAELALSAPSPVQEAQSAPAVGEAVADAALDAVNTMYDLCLKGTYTERLDAKIALKKAILALAASPVPMASSAGEPEVFAWTNGDDIEMGIHKPWMGSAWKPLYLAPPSASLREQEDAAGIAAWLLTQVSGGWSLTRRLYNDPPNTTDSVAAGAWIETVTQHLQRLAKDANPTRLLLEHSGCGNNTQVDQLTVRLNPGDKVVLHKGPITAAIDAQRRGREEGNGK